VDQALAGLRKAHQTEVVHAVRKEIKRMRAIFRLARGGLSRKEYRKTAKLMRLAAKPLAVSRDAHVTQKAFESLAGRKAGQFPNLQSALEAHCRLAERSFKDQDSEALSKYILRKTGGQLGHLKLKQAGWAETKAGLKKSYTDGRGAWKLARLKPSPGHFHDWRKQVKSLWYQLDFLCSDWPPKSKAMLGRLDKLGQQLGNNHDLELLEHFVKEHAAPSRETAAVQQLIDSKRRHFGERARLLGSRLFAKTPELVCAQLERDWKAWRGGNSG
jgi:CHAD domain-containing protein